MRVKHVDESLVDVHYRLKLHPSCMGDCTQYVFGSNEELGWYRGICCRYSSVPCMRDGAFFYS